jgi:hypothetical protein
LGWRYGSKIHAADVGQSWSVEFDVWFTLWDVVRFSTIDVPVLFPAMDVRRIWSPVLIVILSRVGSLDSANHAGAFKIKSGEGMHLSFAPTIVGDAAIIDRIK